jgi:tetratricopeptide (TPR) repeat protein
MPAKQQRSHRVRAGGFNLQVLHPSLVTAPQRVGRTTTLRRCICLLSLVAVCLWSARPTEALAGGRPTPDSAGPQPGSARPPQQPASSYQSLVGRYLEGESAAAVSELAQWSESRLASDVNNSRQTAARPFPLQLGDSPMLLGAAALFHIEVAIRGPERLYFQHLEYARRALEGFTATRFKPDVARRAYRVLFASLLYFRRFPLAAQVLGDAKTRLGIDEHFLLAAGSFSEVSATDPSGTRQRIVSDQPDSRQQLTRSLLRDAETSYRAALEIRPSLTEARLRLGRVLGLLNNEREAVPELERVLRESEEGFLSYLAHLFLADIHTRARQGDLAVRDYGAAIRIYPECQVARLGLSQLLYGADRSREGWEAIAPVFQPLAAGKPTPEPWWAYYAGQSWQTDRELVDLRGLLKE